MKKTDILIFLFVIFASVFTLKALFLPGFYTSHDGPHQVVRAYYYHQLIAEGQIPPRYVGNLNFGFGYPLFIFSYQMPWLIAEVFRQLGSSVFDSIKLTYVAGYILSGIFMYLYQKKIFGRFPAYVGTLIYLYAPYRFSNIFVRSAMGDATAFIFAPLLFWSVDLLFEKINIKNIIFLALAMSALILSHAMVAFLFFIGFSIYVLFRLLLSRNWLQKILALTYSLILFVLFSAFYLLPSLMERNFTKFQQLMGSAAINLHFVPWQKLIYSSWGYGTVDALEGAMSLSIGVAQIIVAVIVITVIISFLLNKKKHSGLFKDYGFIFSLIFTVSVFFMTPYSETAWKFISRFVLVDFNWRILSLTVFSASIICGWLFSQIKGNNYLKFTLALLLLTVCFYTNRNHLRINQTLDWSVPFFLKLEKTTNSFDEYNPLWANTAVIKENSPRLHYSGEFSYQTLKETNSYYQYRINAGENGELTVNTLYYPGWEVKEDGKNIQTSYNSDGLIRLPLLSGIHNLEVLFHKTPLRKISDLLTFFSLLISGIYLIIKLKND